MIKKKMFPIILDQDEIISRPAGFSYSWVRGGPQTWKEMGGKERESEDQVD